MASRACQQFLAVVVKDLTLRLEANMELAITKVQHGTYSDGVASIVNWVYDKMIHNTDKTIILLEDMFKFPFQPRAGNNPYRPIHPEPRRPEPPRREQPHQSAHYDVYTPPKKKAAHIPPPILTPGKDHGPKPIAAKLKAKGVADWEGWTNCTWGSSENWEDLALHAAHKNELEIKKSMIVPELAEWDEVKKNSKVGGKGKYKA
ncbi:hypothetical protein VTL71DRAFT_7535 [Oculimacula yallundae]|uniref:Uncharacterized protein n=1 Tax=Oculimacula yallundae TaxID=86028 RepID=A0ABR4BV77_9HELO